MRLDYDSMIIKVSQISWLSEGATRSSAFSIHLLSVKGHNPELPVMIKIPSQYTRLCTQLSSVYFE